MADDGVAVGDEDLEEAEGAAADGLLGGLVAEDACLDAALGELGDGGPLGALAGELGGGAERGEQGDVGAAGEGEGELAEELAPVAERRQDEGFELAGEVARRVEGALIDRPARAAEAELQGALGEVEGRVVAVRGALAVEGAEDELREREGERSHPLAEGRGGAWRLRRRARRPVGSDIGASIHRRAAAKGVAGCAPMRRVRTVRTWRRRSLGSRGDLRRCPLPLRRARRRFAVHQGLAGARASPR